jgi:3-methyladenine DNA glycosylase AlkC
MEPLKNMYNAALLGQLADAGVASIPSFDKTVFLQQVFDGNWNELELKQRIRRISTCLHGQMTGNFPADVAFLLAYTDACRKLAGRDNTFEHIFIPDYLEQYGLEHPAIALNAMERITIQSSCEFAIRPYLIRYQDVVMELMQQWSQHSHASVRRLSSEGCRPRLPWGMAIPAFKKDPSPVLPILHTLRTDPSEYVRKSVANNLNDIAKDNPDIVLQLAGQWLGQHPHTDWIVKHGCRTLLKKGNTEVLALFGLSDNISVAVTDLLLKTNTVRVGEYLEFSFSLANNTQAAVPLRLEYAITYAKAGSKSSRKVFKISEKNIAAGSRIPMSSRQSFADMTTRKHYEGGHKLEILLNGATKAQVPFTVVR